MEPGVFTDRKQEPTAELVGSALGDAAGLWTDLLEQVTAKCGPVAQKWGYSGKKYGWALKVERKRKALLYLTPGDGWIRAGVALNEKAAAAARASDLPTWAVELLDTAQKYSEGYAVRFLVPDAEASSVAVTFAALKASS